MKARLAAPLVLLSLLAANANAGTTCEPMQLTPELVETGAKLSQGLINKVNELRPEVAIIARVGSDSSKYGIKYTHMGFLVKNGENWEVMHLLNSCGTSNSHLYKQGLLNFYIDDLFVNDTLLVIPTRDFQTKLLHTFRSKMALQLHKKHYSLIAYPFSTKYQNSNQWVLETLAHSNNTAANNRTEVQKYLQSSNYNPQVIQVSALEKFGAGFKSNVALDDHPLAEQQSNSLSVVTVDSVVNWMKANNLVANSIEF